MPARKAEPRQIWEADATMHVEKLAFSVQYIEHGKGSQSKRYITPLDWLDLDKKSIVFDTGKRLKGWLKQQAYSLGGDTRRDAVSYGVVCKSLPEPGYVKIGELSDIAQSRTWDSFQKKDDYNLNGFPAPEVAAMLSKEGRSIFAMWYIIQKPIDLSAKIFSFGRGLRPDLIKNWLETVGINGLGDKHNASEGYGSFTLKDWKFLGERPIEY